MGVIASFLSSVCQFSWSQGWLPLNARALKGGGIDRGRTCSPLSATVPSSPESTQSLRSILFSISVWAHLLYHNPVVSWMLQRGSSSISLPFFLPSRCHLLTASWDKLLRCLEMSVPLRALPGIMDFCDEVLEDTQPIISRQPLHHDLSLPQVVLETDAFIIITSKPYFTVTLIKI